ncbi:MAG: PKD domain-containing protein, partial [Candidatus Hermodarchaeota archaeon]
MAITLITIILIADFTKLGISGDLEVTLDANPTTADVGEKILFNWTIIGNFDSGWINFGDGNITSLAYEEGNSSITHKYTMEGKYNVTLYATTGGLNPTDFTDSEVINIINNPPQFNISLLTQAFEDENINVSVTDMNESNHDLEDGLLTYIYDFADGTQKTSNQSSFIHKWTNAGVFPVTITVIDDQGALDQKTQEIQILNKNPDAYFSWAPDSASNETIGSYFGSYDFRGDMIGDEPKNLDVYDSDDVNLEKVTLRANGDGEWNTWSPGEGSHWELLDEETPDNNPIAALYHTDYV